MCEIGSHTGCSERQLFLNTKYAEKNGVVVLGTTLRELVGKNVVCPALQLSRSHGSDAATWSLLSATSSAQALAETRALGLQQPGGAWGPLLLLPPRWEKGAGSF